MTTDSDACSRDALFEVLSNSRRRYILSRVRAAGAPVELTRVAREIGAVESGVDVEELDQTAKKRVYVSLYQTHVPKLEAVGLVRYDENTKTIAVTDDARRIDRYLQTVPPVCRWYRVNGALSLLSGAVVVGAVADMAVLSTVTPVHIGVALVGALLSVTLAQAFDYVRRRRARPPELREQ